MSRKRTREDKNDDAEMHDVEKTNTTIDTPVDAEDTSGSEENSADEEGSMVDVEFEFFEPTEIDFHGMKSLLKSSFGDDAQDFDISGLADLILEQGEIGSTVKTDGEDSDPYALLTVVDLTKHKQVPVVRQIKDYLLKKAEKSQHSAKLADILDASPGKNTGLLISERVVNVPPQVVAPMLRMLVDEMKAAETSYDFEHFVLVCPLYRDTEAVADDPDSDDDSTSTRNRKKPLVSVRRYAKSQSTPAMDLSIETHVYAEEEFIEEFACLKFDYKFTRTKRVAESRNSFADSGLSPFRRCLVIHRSKLNDLVDRLNDVLSV
ncbi:Mss4p nuclear export [Coemansia sp. RSA 1933]|nr:Mss4p nuclear export [Coemansia sp. RSA 1933]